jgi:hypothetical protein
MRRTRRVCSKPTGWLCNEPGVYADEDAGCDAAVACHGTCARPSAVSPPSSEVVCGDVFQSRRLCPAPGRPGTATGLEQTDLRRPASAGRRRSVRRGCSFSANEASRHRTWRGGTDASRVNEQEERRRVDVARRPEWRRAALRSGAVGATLAGAAALERRRKTRAASAASHLTIGWPTVAAFQRRHAQDAIGPSIHR